jgi:hypothetical protein
VRVRLSREVGVEVLPIEHVSGNADPELLDNLDHWTSDLVYRRGLTLRFTARRASRNGFSTAARVDALTL